MIDKEIHCLPKNWQVYLHLKSFKLFIVKGREVSHSFYLSEQNTHSVQIDLV